MKTSNKLLLGFSGVLALLMLFSAIILKANYNKGITNTDTHQSKPDPDYKNETLQPFKVVIITDQHNQLPEGAAVHKTGGGNNTSFYNLYIRKGDNYSLEHSSSMVFSHSGDTLFIGAMLPKDITLTCPSLEEINSTGFNVYLNDVSTPRLLVHSGPGTETVFRNTNIQSLSYTGEVNNAMSMYDDNKLDTVKVRLGKGSALKFEDVTYHVADIVVDSLRELRISGKALNSLKQIN